MYFIMGGEIMKLKTVCYALNEYFSVQPGHITLCPLCKTSLEVKSTDPTACGLAFMEQGLIPGVDTVRSHCPGCSWWMLREIYTEYEGSGVVDLLVTLLPETDGQSEPVYMESDNSQPPWDALYGLGNHWKKQSITAKTIEWLWGERE